MTLARKAITCSFSSPAHLNWLFYLGVFLIPFDNLFFAPSSGWAAISPIVFVLYALVNFKSFFKNGSSYLGLAMFFGVYFVAISLLNYAFVGFNASNLIGSLASLACGLSFYASLVVFRSDRSNSVQTVLNILFFAYLLSFVYGLLDRFNVAGFSKFAEALAKRYYPDKLQFTFTEPSFISMHLYGIMLPLIIVCRKKYRVRKNLVLFFAFLVASLAFGASARFLIDTALVAVVFLVVLFVKVRGSRLFILIFLPILIGVGVFALTKFAPQRIQQIFELGIYSDNSLAARFFRINAIIKGQVQDPRALLFGYGFSNAYIPFNIGYEGAFAEATNAWMDEIIELKGVVTDTFFCMPIRVLAEFGLVGLVLFLVPLFTKKNFVIALIVLFLYLQFDSFAFYSLWLLLFLNSKRERQPHAYLAVIVTALRNHPVLEGVKTHG